MTLKLVGVVDLEPGQRVHIRGKDLPDIVTIGAVQSTTTGVKLYVEDDSGAAFPVFLDSNEIQHVEVLSQDGAGDPDKVLAGLWAEWMCAAGSTSGTSILAATPLRPYAHQSRAVYGAMLPQPMLRFLLADEPGTGKTIMGGLWLREMQRLGFIDRALVVCPAHLVSKWQEDFERFLGGPDCLRRITADTVHEHAVGIGHDMWIVSLELAGMNQGVLEAISPERAGWDAVVFDEAHRMTPTAGQWHRVGLTLTQKTPRVVLMTATPHRGNEWLFRSLMHLVDPAVYPGVEKEQIGSDQPKRALRPGPLHFLRRMKEELVDYDNHTRLFKGRHAQNINVSLNLPETAFYTEALDLVEQYFPASAAGLAKMVYGKRAASCLYSLAETLRRRSNAMNTFKPPSPAGTVSGDPWDADENDSDEDDVVHAVSNASREERKAIQDLLVRLDTHLDDGTCPVSKWPRLIDDCFAPNGIFAGNAVQAVVFTEFADTADWLVARLNAQGFSAERYSGRDLHPVRDQVRAGFASRKFQILVSTDAGNEGIDLQTAHVLVNWDIPWSLVRLEQRMGRIHRVGQTRDVELYNLVATGTREGDALLRLLDNLCSAANEMHGKMFDSLSLVAEKALSEAGIDDLEQILRRTYETGRAGNVVNQAIQKITKDRLRQIHELARKSEDDLASGVEMAKAISALHDESLERINPHIVERFLTRIARANLIGIERSAVADEGLWYVYSSSLPLPSEFPTSNSLVATSGSAKRDALNAGAAAAGQAIALGPGEPAFTSLSHLASKALRPSLYRGGRLNDPNSITDYDLFVYEVPVIEGSGRRSSRLSYLVRSDSTGARAIKWETLANIERGEIAAKTAHPSSITHADTAADLALKKDVRKRKLALKVWLTEARTQLLQLPNDLTDDIEDHADRLAARMSITDAVSQRIKELESAVNIEVGNLGFVGWAYVRGTAVPPDPKESDSETIAMVHVRKLLESEGWGVADRHFEKDLGFDLHATKAGKQRCIEVKGIWGSASSVGVRMTGQEVARAGLLADDYWLYVVEQCQDSVGTLFHSWQNPASVFADATKDVAIVRIPGSALSAAREMVAT
jgi:superfamily II DNA or RNA helicase